MAEQKPCTSHFYHQTKIKILHEIACHLTLKEVFAGVSVRPGSLTPPAEHVAGVAEPGEVLGQQRPRVQGEAHRLQVVGGDELLARPVTHNINIIEFLYFHINTFR